MKAKLSLIFSLLIFLQSTPVLAGIENFRKTILALVERERSAYRVAEQLEQTEAEQLKADEDRDGSLVRTDSESDYFFGDPSFSHFIPRALLSRNLQQEKIMLLAALRMETDTYRKQQIINKLVDLARYEPSQQHD